MRSAFIRRVYRLAPGAQCGLWLGFVAMQWASGRAERQLAALRTGFAAPAALQLEIAQPEATPAVERYEVELAFADQPARSFVFNSPAATWPAARPGAQPVSTPSLALSRAGLATAPLPLRIQIAARAADGCIAYGGERRLLLAWPRTAAAPGSGPAAPGRETQPLIIKVLLQRLPRSICT